MNGDKKEHLEVLFVHLTIANGIHPRALARKADKFFQALSFHTKCHIYTVRGYEPGKNSHEHIIVLIPRDELERFNLKFQTFVSKKAWSWVHLVTPFDHKQKEKAYTYTLVKHEPVLEDEGVGKSFFCPLYYGRCKKHLCDHRGHIDWKNQLDLFPLA